MAHPLDVPDFKAASRYDERPGRPKAGSQSTSSTADEKKGLVHGDDDASIDALIADLQSEDGLVVTDQESSHEPGGGPTLSDELLQTNPRFGLTDGEVLARRKRYGWNKMKEEKENLILKVLSYFIGPIQFVMEVKPMLPNPLSIITHCLMYRPPQFLPPAFRIGLTSLSYAVSFCSMPQWVSSRSSRLGLLSMNSRKHWPSRL